MGLNSVFETGYLKKETALRVKYWSLSVSQFEDGKAKIKWTLYPDDRYFADEDGYGMGDKDEAIATAVIDE